MINLNRPSYTNIIIAIIALSASILTLIFFKLNLLVATIIWGIVFAAAALIGYEVSKIPFESIFNAKASEKWKQYDEIEKIYKEYTFWELKKAHIVVKAELQRVILAIGAWAAFIAILSFFIKEYWIPKFGPDYLDGISIFVMVSIGTGALLNKASTVSMVVDIIAKLINAKNNGN